MSVSWREPARDLANQLSVGLDALWSLVYAAQSSALELALVGPLDEDLSLTAAGMDLAEALSELEWVRPELATCSVAFDPGPAPLDDVTACRACTAGSCSAPTFGSLASAGVGMRPPGKSPKCD